MILREHAHALTGARSCSYWSTLMLLREHAHALTGARSCSYWSTLMLLREHAHALTGARSCSYWSTLMLLREPGSSTRVYAWRIMYVLINQAHLGHEGAKECVPVIGPFFFFFSSL